MPVSVPVHARKLPAHVPTCLSALRLLPVHVPTYLSALQLLPVHVPTCLSALRRLLLLLPMSKDWNTSCWSPTMHANAGVQCCLSKAKNPMCARNHTHTHMCVCACA